jgi:hypothetical protein
MAHALARGLRRHKLPIIALFGALTAIGALALPFPPVTALPAMGAIAVVCVAALALAAGSGRTIARAVIAVAAGSATGTALGSLMVASEAVPLIVTAALSAALAATLPTVAVFSAYRRSGIGVSLAIDETAVGLADLLPSTAALIVLGWLPLAFGAAAPAPALGGGLATASAAGFAMALAAITALLATVADTAGRRERAPPQPLSSPRRWRLAPRTIGVIGVILGVAAIAAAAVAAGSIVALLGRLGSVSLLAIGLIFAILPLSRGGVGGVLPALLLTLLAAATALALTHLAGFAAGDLDARLVPAVLAIAAADALVLVRRRRALPVQPWTVTAVPRAAALTRPVAAVAWLTAAMMAPAPYDAIAATIAAAFVVSSVVSLLSWLAASDANETLLRR